MVRIQSLFSNPRYASCEYNKQGGTTMKQFMRLKMEAALAMVPWSLACCLALWSTSGAQSQTRVREETRTTATQVRRVSAVIGASVALTAGETFGKVEDIIINDQGCIDFVVVVFEE